MGLLFSCKENHNYDNYKYIGGLGKNMITDLIPQLDLTYIYRITHPDTK